MPRFLSLLLLCSFLRASSQTPPGFYASESATAAEKGIVFISVNKYNATPEEIDAAQKKPKKNAPMTMLQIPVEATRLALFSRDFECKLYGLDTSGRLKWEKTLGFSKRSAPAPLAVAEGFVYTGAPDKTKDEVIIRKLSNEGTQVWETRLDSLENVDAICYAENLVNLLVSFDHREKKTDPDGTFSYVSYPVYFFVQLDPVSGKLIRKEYQMMGNYLSSIGYIDPLINTNYSYLLKETDSIAFLTVMDQRQATIASGALPPRSEIAVMTAGSASTHYLVVEMENNRPVYRLYTDFYGRKEKYQSPVPEPVQVNQRRFLLLDKQENLWTIITRGAAAQVYKTKAKGETALINKFAGNGTLVTAAGILNGHPYLVLLTGRDQPGKNGQLNFQLLDADE